MISEKGKKYIKLLKERPYKYGHLCGFTLLTNLHNDWIKELAYGRRDYTLQAHRGSYKTTVVAIVLAILIILKPNKKILFMRKTDTAVKEIIEQVKKILLNNVTQAIVHEIYGVHLRLLTDNSSSIHTNLCTDPRGTSQLVAMGTKSPLTGKHFDIIFTDDIVTTDDRYSKAERERTCKVYQELRNVVNRGGYLKNTGTPWHSDDAFIEMTKNSTFEKIDCYETGLISQDTLSLIKNNMTASLFSANYELRHIASDDVIFTDPQTGAGIENICNGEAHIDASYGGEDGTAFCIIKKRAGKIYVFGKLWQKHVDDCLPHVVNYMSKHLAERIWCETNGDKGYLGKIMRSMDLTVRTYHEDMNKFKKIGMLKPFWKDVIFVEGTDIEFIRQICDFNEQADHDDAPDSLASIVRKLYGKDNEEYQSISGL